MTTIPHPLNPLASQPPGVPDAVWSEYTELMSRADRGHLTAPGFARIQELCRIAPQLNGPREGIVAGVCFGCGVFTGWGRSALADQSSGPGVPIVLCPTCDPETDSPA